MLKKKTITCAQINLSASGPTTDALSRLYQTTAFQIDDNKVAPSKTVEYLG